MSNILANAAEMGRSYDFFTDPNSYGAFELTSEHQLPTICIDPRDEDREQLKIACQTPGAIIGKGRDASLALTANDSEGVLYTVEQGMEYDGSLQRQTVSGGGHPACKYNEGLVSVDNEIIDPQDETMDVLREFIRRYGLEDARVKSFIIRIQDAAKRIRDSKPEHNPDQLLAYADKLYPGQNNVAPMVGENRAGFYILNHHPRIGLKRKDVHRGDKPLVVQAYHDNVYASVHNLSDMRGMSPEVRDLRLAALLLRSAATRTVVCAGNKDMKLLHVVPTAHGTQIEEGYF